MVSPWPCRESHCSSGVDGPSGSSWRRDGLPAPRASGAVTYGPRGRERSVGTAAIASHMGRRTRTADAATATPVSLVHARSLESYL